MKQRETSDATSAVRRFRERQRERGLVKKDVWIRPEHAAHLAKIEQGLRTPEGMASVQSQPWTLDTIAQALSNSPQAKSGLLTVAQIVGAEPSLRVGVEVPSVTGNDHVDVLLAVGGEQIMVETLLWPVSSVINPVDFNECVLRTHKFIPLASFSLIDVAGTPYYTVFGAMDVRSSLSSLMFEIQAVADASQCAHALYMEYLTPEYIHSQVSNTSQEANNA